MLSQTTKANKEIEPRYVPRRSGEFLWEEEGTWGPDAYGRKIGYREEGYGRGYSEEGNMLEHIQSMQKELEGKNKEIQVSGV